jgi:hypothetical protein
MQHFPEAFNRYRQTVNTNEFESFEQLLWSFKRWGGKYVPMTNKQKTALEIEARRIGIEKGLPDRIERITFIDRWGNNAVRWRDKVSKYS